MKVKDSRSTMVKEDRLCLLSLQVWLAVAADAALVAERVASARATFAERRT
jgi:hypothetical protein